MSSPCPFDKCRFVLMALSENGKNVLYVVDDIVVVAFVDIGSLLDGSTIMSAKVVPGATTERLECVLVLKPTRGSLCELRAKLQTFAYISEDSYFTLCSCISIVDGDKTIQLSSSRSIIEWKGNFPFMIYDHTFSVIDNIDEYKYLRCSITGVKNKATCSIVENTWVAERCSIQVQHDGGVVVTDHVEGWQKSGHLAFTSNIAVILGDDQKILAKLRRL
jgi:hypothetical protein